MIAKSGSKLPLLLAMACSASILAPPLMAETSNKDWCEAEVATLAGDYMACLLNAHAWDLTDGSDEPDDLALDVQACGSAYLSGYLATVMHDPGSCPGAEASWDGIVDHLLQLRDSSWDAVDQVGLLVSGSSVFTDQGQVVFFNNCAVDVKLMSPDLGTVDGNVIKAGGHESLNLSQFTANQANVVMVAPVTTKTECDRIQCQDWTALQPNTVQRQPSMWKEPNLLYAAYCQPTNAAAAQCLSDGASTPCCGPNMNYDRTFGTHVEITPNTPNGNDFVNLSTNSKPPELCNGTNPDNCVLPSANIFFNVPVQVDMSGGDCACGTLGQRSQLQCAAVDCTDAYTYPTDPKQCACSSGGERGYTVTYCPDQASQLPSIPAGASNPPSMSSEGG
jgi:hypothetical protein